MSSIIEAIKIIQETPELAVKKLDELYHLSISPLYYINLVRKYPETISSLVKTQADLINFLNDAHDFPISLLKPFINLSIDNQKTYINCGFKYDDIIDNWTPELMEYAINQTPYFIQIIPNPTVEIQEKVISKWPWTIEYIKNPAPSAQIIYIQKEQSNEGFIHHYLPKIHPEVQLWVVDNHPRLIYIWPELTTEAQMKLVEKTPNCLPITQYTDYDAFVIAVHKYPKLLISSKIKLPAHLENRFVDEYPHMIDLIKNPNNRTKSIICKRNGNWFGSWWYKLKN